MPRPFTVSLGRTYEDGSYDPEGRLARTRAREHYTTRPARHCEVCGQPLPAQYYRDPYSGEAWCWLHTDTPGPRPGDPEHWFRP